MSFIDEIDSSYRLKMLERQMRRLGINIGSLNQIDEAMAQGLLEAAENQINMLRESNQDLSNKQYAQSLLLRESMKLILKEIKPKRSLLKSSKKVTK